MKADNQHLVDEYVQDFVLDHLEDEAVKREDDRHIMETETWLQQDDSSSRMCVSQWEDREIPTPPPKSTYMSLMNDQSTPPDTPPNHSPVTCLPPGAMGEMMWPQPQPLDLRPLHYTDGEPDWDRREYIPSGMIQETNNLHGIYQRPPSACALAQRPNNHNSGYSTFSEEIKDDVLKSVPVKELNKRLHGYPREVIERLKKQRRTLKNRDYAHNCRTKRQKLQYELEQKNKNLQHDLHRIRSELARVTEERDLLKQRLKLNVSISSLNSSINNLSVDEFYL